jgi:hypothetical protein
MELCWLILQLEDFMYALTIAVVFVSLQLQVYCTVMISHTHAAIRLFTIMLDIHCLPAAPVWAVHVNKIYSIINF